MADSGLACCQQFRADCRNIAAEPLPDLVGREASVDAEYRQSLNRKRQLRCGRFSSLETVRNKLEVAGRAGGTSALLNK